MERGVRRSLPYSAARTALAAAVFRSRAAHGEGVQREGRVYSPEPRARGIGYPSRRLAVVELA